MNILGGGNHGFPSGIPRRAYKGVIARKAYGDNAKCWPGEEEEGRVEMHHTAAPQ